MPVSVVFFGTECYSTLSPVSTGMGDRLWSGIRMGLKCGSGKCDTSKIAGVENAGVDSRSRDSRGSLTSLAMSPFDKAHIGLRLPIHLSEKLCIYFVSFSKYSTLGPFDKRRRFFYPVFDPPLAVIRLEFHQKISENYLCSAIAQCCRLL